MMLNIWETFVRKFVAMSFQILTNLVTLIVEKLHVSSSTFGELI